MFSSWLMWAIPFSVYRTRIGSQSTTSPTLCLMVSFFQQWGKVVILSTRQQKD